jgi:hypothetical protein
VISSGHTVYTPNHARWGCRAIVESSLSPNPTLSLANRSHNARHSWPSFSGAESVLCIVEKSMLAPRRGAHHLHRTQGVPLILWDRHWPIDYNGHRVDEIGRCSRRRIRCPTTDQKQR